MADLDMLVDVVDANDHVLSTIERRNVFTTARGFRVAHVLVLNAANEVLVQKIAAGLRHGGYWGSSCAGYVAAGEAYDQTAKRKLRDELGITRPTLTSLGVTSMTDLGCTKFIGVFTTLHDGKLELNPVDAAGLEFLSFQTIEEQRLGGARTFTPTFLHVLAFLAASGRP